MGLDYGAIQGKLNKKAGQGGGIDRWKPSIGENYIRVVPHTLRYFTETVADVGFMFYSHFGIGPDGNQSMVVCARSANKKARCPVCESVASLRKTGDPRDQAMAGKMVGKRRHLVNIIDLSGEKETAKGIQVYECGGSVYDSILQWCNEKWGDPVALEDGRNLTLTMKVPGGDKMRTEYAVTPDPSTTSIVKILPENWKEQIKKLEVVLPVAKSYDEIKKIMEGDVDYGTANDAPADAGAPQAKASTGHPPAPAAPATSAPAKHKQAPEPEPEPENDGKVPDCFGKMFSTRSKKCTECAQAAPCKKEFLG